MKLLRRAMALLLLATSIGTLPVIPRCVLMADVDAAPTSPDGDVASHMHHAPPQAPETAPGAQPDDAGCIAMAACAAAAPARVFAVDGVSEASERALSFERDVFTSIPPAFEPPPPRRNLI